MTKKPISFVIAFVIYSLLAFGSHNVSAAEYPLQQKLEQCETAFKESRSKSATREQAGKARAKHFKLMIEILQHINDANVKAADEGRPLTPEELSNTVRVMGHLVEMLAKDHLAPKADWSYVY
ncbi:hypothetical protein DFR30_1750 [Thiogranum longum]|uniref:Secreted protein n=1 Tax=Thiogranum longum TaxID=1537524 RepID=A0A4R1HMK2_9GAMM|nr:hypothetical protein [Thiogranum longum]TCK18472.1 hypothetical protein DFR30_1750 [Thiogranum longum]